MKISILFSIIFLFTVSFSFADDNTIFVEKIQMVKQRPLLVELPLIDTEYVEKLKEKGKTNEVEEYLKYYNEYVVNIKKAVVNAWIYNKDIQFKSYSEMLVIIEQNTNKYAIFRFNERGRVHDGNLLKSEPEPSMYIHKESNSPSLISTGKFSRKFSHLNLYLSEDKVSLFGCRLPVTESEAGIYYTIKQFEFTFNFFDIYPKSKQKDIWNYRYQIQMSCGSDTIQFKTSVIYIKKEDLDKGVIIENSSNYYKRDYKIVSNEEWEKAILEKKENIVCAILLPGYGGAPPTPFYTIVLFKASTCRPKKYYDRDQYMGCDDCGILEKDFKFL